MHTLTNPAAPIAVRDTNPAPDWATPAPAPVPVGPVLSMFDPIFLGIDEFGAPVYIDSSTATCSPAANPAAANPACSTRSPRTPRCARTPACPARRQARGARPVGRRRRRVRRPRHRHAIATLKRLQTVMNNRYAWLLAQGRRKIAPADRLSVIIVIVDEIAFFSATVGNKSSKKNSSPCYATS